MFLITNNYIIMWLFKIMYMYLQVSDLKYISWTGFMEWLHAWVLENHFRPHSLHTSPRAAIRNHKRPASCASRYRWCMEAVKAARSCVDLGLGHRTTPLNGFLSLIFGQTDSHIQSTPAPGLSIQTMWTTKKCIKQKIKLTGNTRGLKAIQGGWKSAVQNPRVE